MHYSRSYTKIIIGTRSGIIGKLGIEAENIDYEEDEEDRQDGKEKQTLTEDFRLYGQFHNMAVNGIRQLGETT